MDYGSGASSEAISLLESFWPRVTDEIQNLTSSDFKNPELPLARIKKIMKLDEEVKMISAEAPIIFAKAAELFIQEVTIRAWLHTEENKRRTLQKNDITLAISKYDEFDFLIDIVPREEKKPTKKESNSPNSCSQSAAANTQNAQGLNMMNAIINTNDQSALLNVLNGNGASVGNTILATPGTNGNIVNAGSPGSNVQYYFALPTNGMQNGNSLPLQLQNLSGIQNIQGLPNNLQTIQGLQGLQGAQIILNSNGQPTIFVGNRECT